MAESVIVSVDFTNKDTGVLIVGKQDKGKVEVINAFQGEEAQKLWKRLIKEEEK